MNPCVTKRFTSPWEGLRPPKSYKATRFDGSNCGLKKLLFDDIGIVNA